MPRWCIWSSVIVTYVLALRTAWAVCSEPGETGQGRLQGRVSAAAAELPVGAGDLQAQGVFV